MCSAPFHNTKNFNLWSHESIRRNTHKLHTATLNFSIHGERTTILVFRVISQPQNRTPNHPHTRTPKKHKTMYNKQ